MVGVVLGGATTGFGAVTVGLGADVVLTGAAWVVVTGGGAEWVVVVVAVWAGAVW